MERVRLPVADGSFTLDAAHRFSCQNRDEVHSAFVGMVRSVVEADNAAKCGPELKIVIHSKCRKNLEGLKLYMLIF